MVILFRIRHRFCGKCDFQFEYLASEAETERACPNCLSSDLRRAITAPRISFGSSEADFVPHFDYQLGRHYTSNAEKQAHLHELGKVQTGGFASPRDSQKTEKRGRPAMTRTQFEAWRTRRRATAYKKNVSSIKEQAAGRVKAAQQAQKIIVPVTKRP